MQKSKPIHITYIGRLEQEKGIDVVIAAIEQGRIGQKNIIWYICGDGSYMNRIVQLEKYEKLDIHIYGHVDRKMLDRVLGNTDLVLMPSLFLETFGLVALDTISRGVPVCGFARGGLEDLVHPVLALDPDSPIESFFQIVDAGVFPLVNISDFAYTVWIHRLREMTLGINRILLVSDYVNIVGGAEQYVSDLAGALRSLGKSVELYGYSGQPSQFTRIWLMLISPLAYWRGGQLQHTIQAYKPDLIWMHQITRYIGPHGARAVMDAGLPIYLTHHDISLITPRPSRVYSEGDIPHSPRLGDWIISGCHMSMSTWVSIISVTMKWILVRSIWRSLELSRITHIFPSRWMESHFAPYMGSQQGIIHPHTSQYPLIET